MENHVDRAEPRAPPSLSRSARRSPGARRRPRSSRRSSPCVVVAAILSFDVNPAGPVIVVVAAITAGSLGVRRVESLALKAAAVGLVVGGIVAILFWPFFDVD